MSLFINVINSESLRSSVLDRSLDIAFIDPTLVFSSFCLRAAAEKALRSHSAGKLVTNSLHSELVYCLSASRNIGAGLSNFGIKSDSSSVLVAVFIPPSGSTIQFPNTPSSGDLPNLINGESLALEGYYSGSFFHSAEGELVFSDKTDINQIISLYRISPVELHIDIDAADNNKKPSFTNLEAAVIQRIACQDILAL